jgi:hypothetical protein
MYFAHTGSMSANEGIFLKIPGMGALDKNLDLTKFSPEQQKIMRDVSALKDKTKAAPQDQQQSLESEAATKLRQLDELSPAAGRSFRDAAFKSDAPIIPPPSAETPPRVQTEPDHSRAAQNAPAPPTLAQVLAPSEASVVTLPTPATEPMAPPASVAAPQSAVRMAPAPAIEPIAPPSALASPAPRISAPAHPLLAPLAPHKGPYKQLATPPLSESDVLNDASLAITRQRDHVALNGASEQPLLGQRTPENHADAGAYSKRTQGHADANFGNEADANLRDKLVGTTSHTPSAGFVKTASLRPTF